jgi:hypothetical protein
MMIAAIITAVYLLSAWGCYKAFQILFYHPRGSWRVSKPGTAEIMITFFPIVNTISLLLLLAMGLYEYRLTPGTPTNFFKPKD